MDTIVGHIERISFQNPETGFTVAFLQIAGKNDSTCIVGLLSTIQPGETIRCIGTWKRHLIHGMQFSVSEYHTEAPADLVGIKKYLGSGLIKGIGAAYAKRIVDFFGLDTLQIIDLEPKKLLQIEGIGPKRLEKITACWDSQKAVREVMIFLQSHSISPSFAQKIFKAYGKECIQKVKNNPYSLARDISGFGFKSVDKIASSLGISKEAPERIDAGIEYLLHQCAEEGHVCFPQEELAKKAEEVLEIPQQHIEQRVEALKKERRIETAELVFAGISKNYIWIRSLFLAEMGIAWEISRLSKASCSLRRIHIQQALTWVQEKLKIELADNQKIAVAKAVEQKIHIITGGPGTGKSTITKAILEIASVLTNKIILAAPTGRAAKRMSEITNRKASTIHSLLSFDFKTGKFKYNKENPLDCDLIIVDEASMIDTYLMYSLLKAIPSHARLILVGDINQLPSVGPGNVLRDIINSNTASVTTLNEIFRQAAGSQIITNAHQINRGVLPNLATKTDGDFFFIHAEAPEEALKEIVSLVSQRLPKKYRFDVFDQIQVLAPMRKGVIGTMNLNAVLQETLNSQGGQPLFHGGNKFMVGDKVMQIKNNYQKEVFNGDIGRIIHINFVDQELTVKYEEREVAYEFSHLEEIVLSYAVSIHKYQGSECPCVVIPVHTTHFKLLTRNLIYTGITRGKQLVVLVGTKKALAIAVHNEEVKLRYTGLQQALCEVNRPLP